MSRLLLVLFSYVLVISCSKHQNDPGPTPGTLVISYVFIGDKELKTAGSNENIALDEPIEIRFDRSVDTFDMKKLIMIMEENHQEMETVYDFYSQNKLLKIGHRDFNENTSYKLIVSTNLKSANGATFPGAEYVFTTLTPPLILDSILIDGEVVTPPDRIIDNSRKPHIQLHFNFPVNALDIFNASSFKSNGTSVSYNIAQLDDKTVISTTLKILDGFSKNQFMISSTFENQQGKPFEGLNLVFHTEADTTSKFPIIPDDELMTLVQRQTFRYFWEIGHPVSGMAPDRISSSTRVTTGGSGFGVMSIIVGIERGFITRLQGIERLETIVDFLGKADRFHGVWPHWMNGETGKTIPFSPNDNGGDLVETAYMIQGLLTLRQYLHSVNPQEAALINKINALWEAVEWDWYTQGGQDVLYWHWSPDFGWEKNHRITGWNEALIIYVLAASSPSHTIDAVVYTNGWSRNGAMVNTGGYSYYGYTLPLRNDMGGPLFFSHYSFLGLDPRNLSDQFAGYWEQNVTHSRINHAYCAENPLRYVSYSDRCWGLTASDGFAGYSAHSPNNDRGVITPTAALSSFPYTPDESMKALRFFYYTLGDKLWGEYGFYDAFDMTNSWVAGSYLTIDQGPIILMIENYRTGLLWDLFMSCPEVQSGLTKLGFTY